MRYDAAVSRHFCRGPPTSAWSTTSARTPRIVDVAIRWDSAIGPSLDVTATPSPIHTAIRDRSAESNALGLIGLYTQFRCTALVSLYSNDLSRFPAYSVADHGIQRQSTRADGARSAPTPVKSFGVNREPTASTPSTSYAPGHPAGASRFHRLCSTSMTCRDSPRAPAV